jgi:hypothetical protein
MAANFTVLAQSYYSSSSSSAGSVILAIIIIVICLALYFLPSIIGFARKKSNSGAIFVLNLLLGWIFVGWVISLVWALTKDQQPTTVIMMQQPYQAYPPNYPPYPPYQQPMPPGQNQAYGPGQGQGNYNQPPVTGGFAQVPPNYYNQPQPNQYPPRNNPPNNPWG